MRDGVLEAHPDTITRRFKKLAAVAGLPGIALHDVRHSYATASRDAKIDWKALSHRIGHSDVAFTMKQYVQTDLEASAPFRGCHPSARHRVRTRQATAKQRGADTQRVAASCARRRAARRPVVITAAGSAPGHRPHRCLVQTSPRTRLLPDLTADGFCPGSAPPITQ